ncbi:hypothetical protein M1L60_13115 [Actinoplanes sp. TRM 88003]|uniref:Carboxymuconolactone decarboxylase-like domain-containing protein n=1 Tax=Paractinoplanes aksuensis TaxID=2939490 RepID=A0ABT1DL16_9ACTN|nr:hypothetical protein [Actinoplanes aksuensis]MCO8271533.1 hypothetical protein [Actinoplanes aksuensis]
MTFDLTSYDQPEHVNCLTARDVAQHADLWVLANLANSRKVAAHLLQTATDLMTASQTLMNIFLLDGYDPSRETQTGLTEAQRLIVLTLASACAHNAALFVKEAHRRRIRRAAPGWDPITTPITA